METKMKKILTIAIAAALMIPIKGSAENKLTIVQKTANYVVVQLQNTDNIAGLQFSLRSSQNIVLADPTSTDRTSGTAWSVSSYKPNDSTVNVVIFSLQQESLASGDGYLIQVPFAMSSTIQDCYINLANAVIAAPNAAKLSVTVEGIKWSSSTIASNVGSSSFTLGQNYPNPFNPSTRLTYTLTKSARVRLSVYDMTGREVNRIVDQNQEAGQFTAQWNSTGKSGQTLASGMYFARLTVDNESVTRKMILLK
jgi:hypothetical protein